MSHNYQIYGGIAEEEFVDVPDQDFVEANYEADLSAHPEHFSTTDVQYAQPQDGKMSTEDQHHAYGHEQPEEVYYDGDEGLAKQPVDNSEVKNNGHTEKCLLEAVEQMNIETEQRQFPEEGQPQNNGDDSFAFDEQVPIEHAAMGTGVQDEDPSTPTALVPPTTPKAKNARTLSDIMAAETQYPIPYRSKLTEQFEPGQTLIVKGKTAEDSVRFTINLHHASADFSGNDVPLHVSVRFDEGKIVFNTFSKGEWGKEERKSNPYKKGDDIDIRIRAHDSKFTIYADQKEIKEYEHRVPLSSISHFSIDGDILITHIHWGGKYYPVPYESGITGDGFGPGKTMLIFGTAEKKGKRFHINLLKKNGDIALHFNPRFDEKAIVRNSLIANEWGNEEREGKIPLEKGIGFDLKIVNEEYAFQIFLNDERFCSYAHRMEPHDIHGLQIGGDVEITGIQIF